MKYLNYIAFSLLGIVFIVSCQNENIPYIGTASNIEIIPGYGQLTFNWTFPTDSNAEYIRINYIDNGIPKWVNFSKYSKFGTISNLSDIEYEFEIYVSDKNGNLSSPILKKATPLEPAYKIVSKTLKAQSTFDGVIVTWKNETGVRVRINVQYTDTIGGIKTYSIESSDVNGSTVVTGGIPYSAQDIKLYASNPTNFDQKSDVVIFNIKPYKSIKFTDQSIWIADSWDSDDGSNKPKNLIDNNLTTFWQTNWSAGIPFPHWVILDLTKPRIVSKVGIYNRDHNNAANAMISFRIEGSMDKQTWTLLGEYNDFPTTRNVEILYNAIATPVIRYFKLTGLTARNNTAYLALAEIYLYGAYAE